ncbi:MAG TPA: metallophosphoesterase [Anaerolineae bacterium]|nr:metallophosphoesterase [Anaerolineae bacterium]
MNTQLYQKMVKASLSVLLVVAVFAGSINLPATTAASATTQIQVWSFGVISDTQWTVADDGFNPNTMAANAITQIDQQFVKAGVKFVIAVGDTVDVGSAANIGARALYAQQLYNAGIGFYPLRGNHEAAETPPDLTSGAEMLHAFPQIGTGVNNNTPSDITTALITPTADLANNPPAARTGVTFTVGTNFTEPTAVNTANNSVSYAFQYGNATFMLLDQFDVTGNYYNSTIPNQQDWISTTLASRPANTHAFVFAHKNLLGGNHKDNLFGGPVVSSDPGDGSGVVTATLTITQLNQLTAKQAAENNFVATMQANKVDYVITGHDHHHYVSLVTSPDGNSKVRQIIGQSDSSKYYTPVTPFSSNDTPVQQDLFKVGYYIYTIDGPRVTVDYYADAIGTNGTYGGKFNFVKVSSLHYSLNGKEKFVAQKGSYVMTDDTTAAAALEPGFKGTVMNIVAGTNNGIAMTNYGKAVVNDVTTAWQTSTSSFLYSDILSLNGMADALGGVNTDPFVLSLTYTGTLPVNSGIMTRNANGVWINVAERSFGAVPQFISGPWQPTYTKVGTYGIDPATHTAWAVLNITGDFVVGTYGVFLPMVLK